jgi:hypothetical protein
VHRLIRHLFGFAMSAALASLATAERPGEPMRPAVFWASSEHLTVASEASAVYSALADTLVDSTSKADTARTVLASLAGRSGKLKAHFVTEARRALEIPIIRQLFGGDSALTQPGVYAVPDNSFAFITMLPFTSKTKGRIGDYRVGFWPAERHRKRSSLEAYENPDGFIMVTPENADTPISEHFTLRDFLTHDQQDVWPKYMVLREELVDKLELIIDDMDAHGHPVSKLVVMSGFRTPEYNIQGVGRRGGRALDSRHQFGDAADIYVDNGDGRMADLNGDGRVDTRDVRVLLESVERVEAEHPELVGGEGIYRANRQHGPFLHVDVRGWPARWALIEPPRRKARRHTA